MLRLTFNQLSTKVLGNLAERTIELSTQTGNETITNHPLALEVKNNYEQYNAVVIKRTFSGMGTDIVAADLHRNNCDASLKKILTGFAAFEGMPQSEDAQQLLLIYAETGNIRDKSYADESVILNKRIEKLALPENKARIARLGLTLQVSKLEEAQAAFNTLFLHQAQANATLRQQTSASATRQYLENALRNYFGLITAMRNVAPYDALYTALAEVVKAARMSKRPAGEEETTKTVDN
jgi:hypothetical protein